MLPDNPLPLRGGQTPGIQIKDGLFIGAKLWSGLHNQQHKIEGDAFLSIAPTEHDVLRLGHFSQGAFLSLVCGTPTIARRGEGTSLAASCDNIRDSAA